MYRLKTNKKELKKNKKEIDELVLNLQKDIDDTYAFECIHFALHNFMMSQSFNRFMIKGLEGKDLYQESLIVLWQKAIPGFNPDKGMSFLGFAKMCISRHLITLLNTSINRKKDMPINLSISLDEIFSDDDESGGEGNTLQNLFHDDFDLLEEICTNEIKDKTISILMERLSNFESIVFFHYLSGSSYKEMSGSLTDELGRKCNEKSIDNALLRIRKKASLILSEDGSVPLFDENN